MSDLPEPVHDQTIWTFHLNEPSKEVDGRGKLVTRLAPLPLHIGDALRQNWCIFNYFYTDLSKPWVCCSFFNVHYVFMYNVYNQIDVLPRMVTDCCWRNLKIAM